MRVDSSQTNGYGIIDFLSTSDENVQMKFSDTKKNTRQMIGSTLQMVVLNKVVSKLFKHKVLGINNIN